MTIRLVNTTTRLRVDHSLEERFFDCVDPVFIDAVEQRSREMQALENRLSESNVDVELVREEDLDRLRRPQLPLRSQEIPDMDLLGVYIAHDANHLHSRILVSPEKVLSACYSLQITAKPTLSFDRLYPTLLSAVIVHELAHLLMDPGRPTKYPSCIRSWKHLCAETDRLISEKSAKNDEWANVSVPVGAIEARLKRKGSSADHLCKDVRPVKSLKLDALGDGCRLVEESLANALAYVQPLGGRELKALEQFIVRQPHEYRTGLRWVRSIKSLIRSAESWRKFKATHLDPKSKNDKAALSARQIKLALLVQKLEKPGPKVRPYKF